ncbi:hypothetical protein JG688_00012352 [Phytophthora aleatoria]|uniref:Uncharacterized protein n=1 Tax=Phytophthora aleatoria TaxID=2496075 RepID=A0A8J5M4N8_9STRA|nr:hypothetical protein JG688_00012352 [Phytophthora aleatoria]
MNASASKASLASSSEKPSTANSSGKTRTIIVARTIHEEPAKVTPATRSDVVNQHHSRDTRSGKLASYAALGGADDVERFDQFLAEQRGQPSASELRAAATSPHHMLASTKRKTTSRIQLEGIDVKSEEKENDARKRREEAVAHRKWLNSLPIHERVSQQRQQNALRKWRQMNRDWETFKIRAARRLGKAPQELVMSRAAAYREQREMYDALQKARPLSDKVGEDIWLVSLRNEGTRYVPVGNIFSGLFCPIRESTKLGPRIHRLSQQLKKEIEEVEEEDENEDEEDAEEETDDEESDNENKTIVEKPPRLSPREVRKMERLARREALEDEITTLKPDLQETFDMLRFAAHTAPYTIVCEIAQTMNSGSNLSVVQAAEVEGVGKLIIRAIDEAIGGDQDHQALFERERRRLQNMQMHKLLRTAAQADLKAKTIATDQTTGETEENKTQGDDEEAEVAIMKSILERLSSQLSLRSVAQVMQRAVHKYVVFCSAVEDVQSQIDLSRKELQLDTSVSLDEASGDAADAGKSPRIVLLEHLDAAGIDLITHASRKRELAASKPATPAPEAQKPAVGGKKTKSATLNHVEMKLEEEEEELEEDAEVSKEEPLETEPNQPSSEKELGDHSKGLWDLLVPAVEKLQQKASRKCVRLLLPLDWIVGETPLEEQDLTAGVVEDSDEDEEEEEEEEEIDEEENSRKRKQSQMKSARQKPLVEPDHADKSPDAGWRTFEDVTAQCLPNARVTEGKPSVLASFYPDSEGDDADEEGDDAAMHKSPPAKFPYDWTFRALDVGPIAMETLAKCGNQAATADTPGL